MDGYQFDPTRLLDTGFAIAVAVYLLYRLEKRLETLDRSISKMSRSILLLVLSENGTKKKAREKAKKMIDKEFDREEEANV